MTKERYVPRTPGQHGPHSQTPSQNKGARETMETAWVWEFEFDPKTHTKWQCWDGREKQILGTLWPASLVYLVNLRPVRDHVSKTRCTASEEQHGNCPLYSTCINTHAYMHHHPYEHTTLTRVRTRAHTYNTLDNSFKYSICYEFKNLEFNL